MKQHNPGGHSVTQRTLAALTSHLAACSSSPHLRTNTSSPITVLIPVYQFPTMALYLICVPVSVASPTCHDLTDFLSSHLIILPHLVTLLKSMYLLEIPPHLYLVQNKSYQLLQPGSSKVVEFLGEDKRKMSQPHDIFL